MKYVEIGLLIGIAGYVLTALLSYYLIGKFLSSGHDRGVEVSMTSAFVYGPFGFGLALTRGCLWANTPFKTATYAPGYSLA